MPCRDKRPLLFVGNFLDMHIGTRAISEDLSLRLAGAGWPVRITSRKKIKLLRLMDMLTTVWNGRAHFELALVDVYSGPAFRFAECVCWLMRRLGKPFILTLHGGNLPVFAAATGNRVPNLLGSAVQVTAPSRYLLETMKPYCSKLLLIPNPIPLGDYPVKAATTVRNAAKLVWLRAFQQTYNPQLAVDALAILRPQFPGLTLTMIGPDKGDGTLAAVRRHIRRLGLEDSIQIVGSIPKSAVPQYLSECDIFLNTTDVDNTPVSVLEAMACGLAIVSTNVGGIPYILKHEKNALLVEPRAPHQMAAAVRRLIEDESLTRRLCVNGRAAVEPFDWPAVLPQWEKLLGAIIEHSVSQAAPEKTEVAAV